MKKQAIEKSLCLLALLVLAGCNQNKSPEAQKEKSAKKASCEITSQSIGSRLLGKVSLGDTKEAILKKIPTADIGYVTDGEGVEYMVITFGGITVYSWENDFLEVQDAVCTTTAGASVGMTIEQLEKIYGRVKRVETNGVNAFEDVVFERSPKNVWFKGYDLGEFSDDRSEVHVTKKFKPSGVIDDIVVTK